MEKTADEITQAALALPTAERSQLADRLNESLKDFPSTGETNDAWVRLAVRRLENVRSGVSGTIDGPSGLSEMRKRVRG
ncbi:MAG: addiction module protein [Pyrinomonadaceae bacterium]